MGPPGAVDREFVYIEFVFFPFVLLLPSLFLLLSCCFFLLSSCFFRVVSSFSLVASFVLVGLSCGAPHTSRAWVWGVCQSSKYLFQRTTTHSTAQTKPPRCTIVAPRCTNVAPSVAPRCANVAPQINPEAPPSQVGFFFGSRSGVNPCLPPWRTFGNLRVPSWSFWAFP